MLGSIASVPELYLVQNRDNKRWFLMYTRPMHSDKEWIEGKVEPVKIDRLSAQKVAELRAILRKRNLELGQRIYDDV